MIGQVPTGSIGRQTSQGKQRLRAASNACMLLSTTANRPVKNESYINWSMILKRFYRLCRQKKVSRPNATQSARIELSFAVSEDLSGERPNRRFAQVIQDLFGNGCSCARMKIPKPDTPFARTNSTALRGGVCRRSC